MLIFLDQLVENDYNPRKFFQKKALTRLCKSIKNDGLIEPLVVRPLGNDKYEVIAGIRRFKCLKKLKIEQVECNVLRVDKSEAIRKSIQENLCREDLSPIEEANIYYQAIRAKIEERTRVRSRKDGHKGDLTPYKAKLEKELTAIAVFSNSHPLVKEVASENDLSSDTVARLLHLLILPEEIQRAVHEDTFDLTQAYKLTVLRKYRDEKITKDTMLEFYHKSIEHGWDVKAMERQIEIRLLRDGNLLQRTAEDYRIDIRVSQLKIDKLKEKITREKELMLLDFDETVELLLGENYSQYKTLNLGKIKELYNKATQEKADLITKLKPKTSELNSQIKRLDFAKAQFQRDELNHCPHCLSKITLEEFDSRISALEKEVKEYDTQLDRIDRIHAKLEYVKSLTEARIGEVKSMSREIEEIEEKIKILKEALNEEL